MTEQTEPTQGVDPHTVRDVTDTEIGRRSMVRGVALGGVAVVATAGLAACGSSKNASASSTPSSGQSSGSTPPSTPSASTASSTPSASTSTHAGGPPLATTAEIPVGGGKIFADHHVVVTQPKAGTFKAFSSTCTHQGCTVGQISNGAIICPCHHSEFSVADGSVERGPAVTPLPPVSITVEGADITLNG